MAWLADRDNVIDLCFLIGAVHLSFAHVWNAVSCARAEPGRKVLAQAGWLLVVWSMFFLARSAVLGRGAPGFLLSCSSHGVVLVAAFMKTPARVQDRAGSTTPCCRSPWSATSWTSCRTSACSPWATPRWRSSRRSTRWRRASASTRVLTAVAASLLLLFANALNIVLAGLGVLVHAVRLNTLEFSTHKGLAWQGHTLYTPFAGRGSPSDPRRRRPTDRRGCR